MFDPRQRGAQRLLPLHTHGHPQAQGHAHAHTTGAPPPILRAPPRASAPSTPIPSSPTHSRGPTPYPQHAHPHAQAHTHSHSHSHAHEPARRTEPDAPATHAPTPEHLRLRRNRAAPAPPAARRRPAHRVGHISEYRALHVSLVTSYHHHLLLGPSVLPPSPHPCLPVRLASCRVATDRPNWLDCPVGLDCPVIVDDERENGVPVLPTTRRKRGRTSTEISTRAVVSKSVSRVQHVDSLNRTLVQHGGVPQQGRLPGSQPGDHLQPPLSNAKDNRKSSAASPHLLLVVPPAATTLGQTPSLTNVVLVARPPPPPETPVQRFLTLFMVTASLLLSAFICASRAIRSLSSIHCPPAGHVLSSALSLPQHRLSLMAGLSFVLLLLLAIHAHLLPDLLRLDNDCIALFLLSCTNTKNLDCTAVTGPEPKDMAGDTWACGCLARDPRADEDAKFCWCREWLVGFAVATRGAREVAEVPTRLTRMVGLAMRPSTDEGDEAPTRQTRARRTSSASLGFGRVASAPRDPHIFPDARQGLVTSEEGRQNAGMRRAPLVAVPSSVQRKYGEVGPVDEVQRLE
ncbi:hypothetical protein MKEN_00157000 [Mycena kentingensis (nom. inval.)]|nr:hypothetical protein MKEN_00157000 [Mycena kentingensis (nom. inval.)]